MALRTVLLGLFVFMLFVLVVSSQLAPLIKFGASLLLLGGFSYYLHKEYDIQYYYGMLMLKTDKGLHHIDKIARLSNLWKWFADLGIVMSFGLLTLYLYPKISRKKLAAGLLITLVSAVFILPNLYPVALSVMNLPSLSAKSSEGSGSGLFMLISLAIVIVGYALFTSANLLYQGLTVIIAIINKLGGVATDVQPGASLILPGVNIPLFEGILALLFILFFHELSHAILARVARIKLKSAGVLLFGFIPLGAFVDPDEEELSKASAHAQGRVLVAGSSANFALSFISFFLYLLLILMPINVYDQGLVVLSTSNDLVEKGAVITAINGQPINTIEEFYEFQKDMIQPNSELKLTFASGETISVKTNEFGKIGVILGPKIKSELTWYIFLRNFLALMFALNFFIATVNLLPVPLFDGYRLLEIGLSKHPLVVKTISYSVALAFLANFLPWLF